MKTVVTVEIPSGVEAILSSAGYTDERLAEETQRALALVLFQRKVLSLDQAARCARMPLWAFIPWLGEHGMAVAEYDEAELQRELDTARWLIDQQAL